MQKSQFLLGTYISIVAEDKALIVYNLTLFPSVRKKFPI